MFSRNFYYRIKYQIEKKAPFQVFFHFVLDRIQHPFTKFQKKDTIIFGVNQADNISHKKFINDYSFPFDLLIDTDRKVATKYKALKFMFGNPSILRSVILINKEGKIIFLKRGMPKDKDILESLK